MTVQAFVSEIAVGPEIANRESNDFWSFDLWDPAGSIASWSWTRDAAYLAQIYITSAPIWLADMVAVGVSLSASALIFQAIGDLPSALNWAHIAGWCIALTGGCFLSNLYPAIGLKSATEIRLVSRVIASIVTLCIAYDLLHGGDNKFLMLWPMYGAFMLMLVPISRALVRRAVCRRSWWGLRAIVVGSGACCRVLIRHLERNPALGFKPIAIVDRYSPDLMDRQDGLLGRVHPLDETPALSARHHAYCGFFAGTDFPASERLSMVDALTSVFPQLYMTTDSANAGRQWSGHLDLKGTQLVWVTEQLLMPGARWVKRAADILVILLAAPIVVPLVLLLALCVKLSSPGPVFYGHNRIGRNGRTIRVWKFRSMIPNADSVLNQYLAAHPHLKEDWDRLHKLPKDPRVTSIGRILRKTSLDELPQLWNVFCGQMSLVGPRPIVKAEIQKYQAVYPLYLRVTPGITGLWQINGRNLTTYEERINYDAEYVRNWSLTLDMYILARTILTVLTGDGAC